MGARRLALAAVAMGGFVLLTPRPAGAVVGGSLGCQGHATITSNSGQAYEVDAKDSKATIPTDGSIQYSGSTTPISHNHSGAIKLDLGPLKPKVWSWSSKNGSNQPSTSGTKKIPSQMKNLPPGEYLLTGAHSAQEGSCSGHITLVVKGNPLGNPVGIAGVAGTVVFGAGMLLAGVTKAGKGVV